MENLPKILKEKPAIEDETLSAEYQAENERILSESPINLDYLIGPNARVFREEEISELVPEISFLLKKELILMVSYVDNPIQGLHNWVDTKYLPILEIPGVKNEIPDKELEEQIMDSIKKSFLCVGNTWDMLDCFNKYSYTYLVFELCGVRDALKESYFDIGERIDKMLKDIVIENFSFTGRHHTKEQIKEKQKGHVFLDKFFSLYFKNDLYYKEELYGFIKNSIEEMSIEMLHGKRTSAEYLDDHS